ncbi:MAG: TonB-dependent receptor [Flavobacteriales bacterium]|nr:TonB-dependent receptor [Flavobacteriales bacterium]
MFRLLLIIKLLLLSITTGWTRNIEISILEEGSRQAIPYANVLIVNHGKGSISNANGLVKMEVPSDSFVLRISALGYSTKEITYEKGNENIRDSVFLSIEFSELDEVVISGTLEERTIMKSPIPIEVYHIGFLRKNPSPSLFESLQNINGVRPQINCSVCNTGDIHINGMEGPYTMILIDGMPMVSGLGSIYGLSGIPSALIQRIEIVKGPASTLYGSEAVGGLINVITQSPLQAPRLVIESYASSWLEKNLDAGLSFKAGKQNSLLGINYFHYGNPVDNNGDGFTDLTLQHRISVFNKWNFARKNSKEFSLAARYVYEDRWGGQMNWSSDFRGGDSIYGESIYTGRFEFFGKYDIPLRKMESAIQFSFSDHRQNSAYGNNLFNASQDISFLQYRIIGNKGPHQFTSGAALRTTWYNDNTFLTQSETGADSLHLVNLPGIFLQDEIKINASNRVLVGSRIDHHPQHGWIYSPRLNYQWGKDEKQTLRAGIGNGFRVVNLFTEEHAAMTGSRSIIIPEKLLPEKSWNAQVNYRRNFFLTNWNGSMESTVFYTLFSNKIMPDYFSVPDAIVFSNLKGTAVSRGVGINSDWNFKNRLKISLGATFMDVFRIEDGEKKQQVLTEHFSGVFSISYSFLKWGINLDYSGSIYGPMDLPLQEHDFRAPQSPWYSIQNIKISKTIKGKWSVFAGVKNLLNFVPPAYSIMRPFDPFDQQVSDPVQNPFGYRFDTSYVYSSFQGIRTYFGMRYQL